MTVERNRGNGPVFAPFRELASLPPEERREALMVRLEHVWDEAQAKSYMTKKGKQVPQPDTAVMLKVVQAVAVLQGMTGEAAEADARKLAQMSDAELVREATKRLPAHEVAALGDALIAMREQQRTTVVTTGETADEQREAEPEPEEVEPDGGGFSEPGPGWA